MTILKLAYSAPSETITGPTSSRVELALDGGRGTIGVMGQVRDPELLRDAILTAAALMQSDLRYKGKDRTAYLAHLMKQGKRATAAIWEAQKAFLESAYGDETPRPRGLDPVLTIDPDEVSLEVFSRDESAYARLALNNALFEARGASHGTTLADLSPAFLEQIERIRTYQPLALEASTSLVRKNAAPVPREIEVPDAWLRGFLQVQSAATLPRAVAHLGPVDLYNVLFTLRMHKAKKAPRALRFELVPGARPRVVVEPWEIALECHGEPFSGSAPRIVRIYGRQRLQVLERALPHVTAARVHLLGHGLPSFWVLDMGLARLTVALTSWSESKWASAASFDSLMPKANGPAATSAAVSLLAQRGPLPLSEIAKATATSPEETRAVLQRACLEGRVLFDLDRGVYRPRALLAEPVDTARIRYGSEREATAHRLLGDGAAPAAEIAITKIHTIAGEGQEISGEVKHARRTFSPRFTIDVEGQVREAWCNCPTYQRSAMREGPCEHMIALYVFESRARAEAERLRTTIEGRKLVRAETRVLMRRDPRGGADAVEQVRLSLDDRVVRIERRESAGAEGRFQRMWFDTDAEAREAYFARLDELADKGFIDTEASTA
ncbi:SWIM zinc finger family protein [Pendulispora albinea]|uniref:SWIM zinc finger family protein n=1 Tax=Pendulispora albinea TaxID=2741071 RepID=A0ABZ2LVZ1_9BACT